MKMVKTWSRQWLGKVVLKISKYMSVWWVWGGELKRPHTLEAERAREEGGGTGTWRKGEEVAGPGEQLLVLRVVAWSFMTVFKCMTGTALKAGPWLPEEVT